MRKKEGLSCCLAAACRAGRMTPKGRRGWHRRVLITRRSPPRRVTPGADGGAYLASFGTALRGAGYDGTVSIECGWTEFEAEMIRGLAFLRAHF